MIEVVAASPETILLSRPVAQLVSRASMPHKKTGKRSFYYLTLAIEPAILGDLCKSLAFSFRQAGLKFLQNIKLKELNLDPKIWTIECVSIFFFLGFPFFLLPGHFCRCSSRRARAASWRGRAHGRSSGKLRNSPSRLRRFPQHKLAPSAEPLPMFRTENIRRRGHGRGPRPWRFAQDVANVLGAFQFDGLKPNVAYRLTIQAKGFVDWKSSPIVLSPGQVEFVSGIQLELNGEATSVMVHASSAELATEQVQILEEQRILGIVPNFYVAYDKNAPALDARIEISTGAPCLCRPHHHRRSAVHGRRQSGRQDPRLPARR